MSRKRISGTTIVDQEHKKKKKQKGKDDAAAAADSCSYLPEELIIENILTRLSVRDLAQYSCVSKLWYNSIIKDARFAASHFAHHKHKKELDLGFYLNNVSVGSRGALLNSFFSLQKENNHSHNRRNSDDEFLDLKFLAKIGYGACIEPVGYCNGLTCFKRVDEPGDEEIGVVAIINPVSGGGEVLHFPYFSTPNGGSRSLKYLCSGFGFDSLSQVYKAVLMFTSSTTTGDQVFISKVVTLGTNSWRHIVTSISEITPPPGCSPFPTPLATRACKNTCKSGTLCGGELVWRVTNSSSSNGYEVEMLLSFDIHNENFHFIRLPTECSSLTPAVNDEHQYAEVGDHLLEFKGYPCVARCEKIVISNRDHNHRRRRRHCKQQNGFCCYRFKVHLYILKDRVKQIWAKEESFDVRIKEEDLAPDPFCCYFGTSSAPPTRVLCFSDQVLLYWFDGECLIFYNLQMKQLKVVVCSRSSNRDIFVTKMEATPLQDRAVGDGDDNICFPCIDYQLYAQVENILSLRTFFPKGEVHEFNTRPEFRQFMDVKELPYISKTKELPWLTRLRKLPRYCAVD